MKCSHVRGLVSPYIDDELGADEKRAFLAHVEGCLACREELEESRQIRGLFASAGRFDAPPYFDTRVMARLDEAKEPWTARLRQLFAARPFFLRTVEVAFALVIMLIGVMSGNLLIADRTAERQPTVQEAFSLDLFQAAPPDSVGGAYMRLAGVADER